MAILKLSGGVVKIEFVDKKRELIKVSGVGAASAHAFLDKFATKAAQLSDVVGNSFSYNADGMSAAAVAYDTQLAEAATEKALREEKAIPARRETHENYVSELAKAAAQLKDHKAPRFTGNFVDSTSSRHRDTLSITSHL